MKKISESEQEIMMAIWNAENKNSITASNFVVSLYDGDELSRQDVKELREFLDEISTKSEEE